MLDHRPSVKAPQAGGPIAAPARRMVGAMAHAHGPHMHGAAREGDRRRLTVALALILALMAGEIAAGAVAHSLALLSDAGHMLADAGAIGFSLLALRLAARPARGAMTFGLHRAEILSAQANGVTLLVLAALIVYEAVRRLLQRAARARRAGAGGRARGRRRSTCSPRGRSRARTGAASTSRAASSTC